MFFHFLYNLCLKYFSFSEEMRELRSKTCIGLRVQFPLFLSDINETRILHYIFEKFSNINFHNNPSTRTRGIPCGETDGQI
jgi:hypothetical protein